MGIGATIAGSVGGSLVSGLLGNEAAEERAGASRAAIEEQRRQFNRLLELQQPYRQVGTNALYQQAGMMGLGNPERMRMQAQLEDLQGQLGEVDQYITPEPSPAVARGGPEYQMGNYPSQGARAAATGQQTPMMGQQTGERQINPEYQRLQEEISALESQMQELPEGGGDMSIEETPGYQFRFDEGMDALNNSLAASGNRFSGAAAKEAMRFGQGIASQEFGNRFNRLSALSGRGQTAVQNAGQAGMNMASNIGNLQGNIGAAQAGGLQSINQAVQGGIGNILASRRYDQFMNQLGAGGGGGGMPSMSGPYGVQAGR